MLSNLPHRLRLPGGPGEPQSLPLITLVQLVPLVLTSLMLAGILTMWWLLAGVVVDHVPAGPSVPYAAASGAGNTDLARSAARSLATTAGLTPEVRRWSEQISIWAEQYALDPALVAVVMQIESCGNPDVRSPAGAMGLFQVMPFHFGAEQNPYDPSTNAARGLSYLKHSLELGAGRIDLALAGYNGGHSVIERPRASWPEETRRYVLWGTRIHAELLQSDGAYPTLGAWLTAGGASLCQGAARVLSSMES